MLDKEIEGFLQVNIDMLCVADIDGNLLKVNQAFEHVLGYTVEELEDKNFVSLVHVEDRPSTLLTMKDLEEQKSILSFINRYRCKDGSYRYLEWRAQPNGSYIYASARDITEKHKMEMEVDKNSKQLMKRNEKLQKKNDVLKTLAVTDELTSVYNRHFLDMWIEKEMERSDCDQKPLSMIILDLDHFKRVNDKWGHPVGDEVLKQTVEIARSLIHKSDILVRLGGEEFVVVMPQSTITDALVVAEKIRKTMESNEYSIVGHVTASFGVSERRISESFYNWYKRADEALYRAKEGGRNRVVNSDDQESVPVASVHLEWKSEWGVETKRLMNNIRNL